MLQSIASCLRRSAFLLLAVMASSPAWAHHTEGGKMPETFGSAFLGGLGHPVIGMDHLVAVLLVGFLSFVVTRRLMEPALFVLASLAGCLARVWFGGLPGIECAIALTLPVMLFMMWFHRGLAARSGLVMLIGGSLHGYAYGDAIVGVGSSQLFAYLLGLTLVQAFLAYGFGALSGLLAEKSPKGFATLENMLSAVASGTALVFLVTSLR